MEEYSAKLITAQEAASLINSNDRLFTGGGVNIPKGFSTALGARARDLCNVTIYQGFAMDLYSYMTQETHESFNIETMFVGPLERICMDWGVGSYKPHSIGHMLYDKKNLGMHSEVITPSVTELVKHGVLDCSKKNFYPGKIITGFAVGTKQFYDDIDRNEIFEFKEVHWVNDPVNIAKNDKRRIQ